MLNRKSRVLAQKFSSGRITVKAMNGPPEYNFEPRFFPRIAGHYISPLGMPNQGYRNRREARTGGAEYKAACRKALRPSKF